nr:immunoglobulin heavy chain junction region [Macaca mulatta]
CARERGMYYYGSGYSDYW